MNINKLLKEKDFDRFFKIISTSDDFDTIVSEIYKLGINEENVLAYYACVHLINNEKDCIRKAELHHTAALVLTMGLSYLNGAYLLGFFHVQKALELDETNVNYKEYMLSTFADSPEINVEKNYIKNLVDDILKYKPESKIALRFQQKWEDI